NVINRLLKTRSIMQERQGAEREVQCLLKIGILARDRMTLQEKVEQLRGGRTSSYGIVDPTGSFTEESIRGNFRQIYAMHARLSPHDEAVFRNALQRYAVEKTRLGIPQIFQDEALHGYTAEGATSFPQAIALASTWDPELVKRVFTAVADEAA